MFLTELDPRAQVKGSRDPLGYQPLWTHFGRSVVGNLTTVTRSLRNFTVLLLGLHFADRLIDSKKVDEEQRADLFLKFEQLAAYSRYAKLSAPERQGILGIQRVFSRLAGQERLRISAKRDAQILSNQKTYGIWGLYSVAAETSGYSEEHRLSMTGQEAVERYLPKLEQAAGKDGSKILALLEKDRVFDPNDRDEALAGAIATTLRSKLQPWERGFYGDTLVLRTRGGSDDTHGNQRALWQLLQEAAAVDPQWRSTSFGARQARELRESAESHGHESLAKALADIGDLEPVLAASRGLFQYLLQREGASRAALASELRKAWGPSLAHFQGDAMIRIEPRMAVATDPDAAARIVALATALADGDYALSIDLTLSQNAAVMTTRGGLPWASLDDGKLKVRYRENLGGLPAREELPTLWGNSYFVDSLKAIGWSVFGEVA